MIVLGIGFL